MRRREFIGGAVVGWPLAVRAQERMRRIGVLQSLAAGDPDGPLRMGAFLRGLQQLGWIDGRNVRIDIRWSGGNADLDRKYAAELVALAPDVLLATASPTVAALQAATRTVPIVFAHSVDPVGAGFIDSLARPGGNTTGFVLFEYGISAKWLELLKEIAPGVKRVDPSGSHHSGRDGPVRRHAIRRAVIRSRGHSGELARHGRDRTRGHGLGGFIEWRSDRNRGAIGDAASRSDHCNCGPAQTARDLFLAYLRNGGRPCLLWA